MVRMVVGICGNTSNELRDIFELFYVSPKSINGLDGKQATNTKSRLFLGTTWRRQQVLIQLMVHMVVGVYGNTLHELRDIFKLFYISPKSINGLEGKQAKNTKSRLFLGTT